MKIFVLEDEMLVALDLEQQLKSAGYDVAGPATTMAMARAIIDAEDIDLALLDANIAGEKPVDIANSLKDRGVPLLYLSGYDEAHIRSSLPEAPLLQKPIQSRELLDRIKALAGAPQRI